jgi:hypothetical protein
MRKRSVGLTLVCVSLFVSSCAGRGEVGKEAPAGDDEVVTVEAETMTSEAIFTYNSGKNLPCALPEIDLTLSGEPIQIMDQGFIKLRGLILGESPAALVEIAGKGVLLKICDKIGGYVVEEITSERVRLKENKNVL